MVLIERIAKKVDVVRKNGTVKLTSSRRVVAFEDTILVLDA